MIITNEHSQRIEYLGQTYSGKTRDKKVTENEDIHYPPGSGLKKDTGVQRYEPPGVGTLQPKKNQEVKNLGLPIDFSTA